MISTTFSNNQNHLVTVYGDTLGYWEKEPAAALTQVVHQARKSLSLLLFRSAIIFLGKCDPWGKK